MSRYGLCIFSIAALWAQYDAPGNLRVYSHIEGKLGSVSPGGLMKLTGESLAKGSAEAPGGFADVLGGTRVEVEQGGKKYAVPVASVSPKEIVAQAPFDLAAGAADIRVTTALGTRTSRVQVAAATPAPLTLEGVAGGVVRAYHADGRQVVDADAPATPGEVLDLVAAGLGRVAPAGMAGRAGGSGTTDDPFQKVEAKVVVVVGEVEAAAEEAILSPEAAGEYRVRFAVPAELKPGWHVVLVKAGDAASTAGNRIYVGPPKQRLNDAYLEGRCGETAEFRFTLRARAWVRAIGIRAKFAATGGYQLMRGEELVSEGVVWARNWETSEPEWRWGAFQWPERELEAGEYLVKLSNVAACVDPEQPGRLGWKLEGGWMESLWSDASEGRMDEAGGEVAAPGIAIGAEAGAMQGPVDLRIQRYEEETNGRKQTYFRVEGLPERWQAPLKVALDVGELNLEEGEEAAIAVKTATENGLAPRLIAGKVEGGRLLAELPPYQESKEEETTAKPLAWRERWAGRPERAARPNGVSALMWAALGMRWTNSMEGHFIVHYPKGEETLAKSVGEVLENAYKLIEGMGLDWNRRKSWPLEVYLFSYSSWSSYVLGGSGNNEGNTESELWGNEGVGLCLNLDTIRYGHKVYLDDAKLTSGHELLHIAQTLYDPRGRLRKTFGHSTWLWLMEASATWLERAVAEKENYVPFNAIENWSFLFQRGLEAPPGLLDGAGARRHGYGASAFLQHLAPAERGSASTQVGEILKLLSVVSPVGEDLAPVPEYSPVRAIRKVLGDTAELKKQWHEFADRYIRGEVWNGFPGPDHFLRATPAPSIVKLSKTLTSYKSTVSLAELSANHFLIQFDSANAPALTDKSRLRVRIVDYAQGTKAFLYAVGEAGLLPLGDFTGEFEVEDAAGLFSSGRPMYLLLANGRNTFGGREKSSVEVQIAVDEPFEGTQSFSDTASCTCYNAEYSVDLTVEVSASAPFRVAQKGKALPCLYRLWMENTPWSPDNPEVVDSYTVRFSVSNLKHKFKWSDIFKDPSVELLYSVDGVKYSLGRSGSFEVRFHRGARVVTGGVVIRPVLVYDGDKQHNLTGGGDQILDLEVVGLK